MERDKGRYEEMKAGFSECLQILHGLEDKLVCNFKLVVASKRLCTELLKKEYSVVW